jgi:putative hydrolase of the HAD superfamily
VSRWRAVIFDLDDTLYSERSYVLSGFRAVARWIEARTGSPAAEVYQSLHALFCQGVRGDTFDRWLAAKGLPPDLTPTMVDVYRTHRPEIDLFPGVRATLQGLRPVARLGLVSDGPRTMQRAKLDALGVDQLFSAVLLTDELGRDFWKPSPVPFQKALGLLGVSPQDCVYVGDNCAKDFIGARSIRLSTIWVRYSGGDYCRTDPPAPSYAADLVADTLPELNALLGLE